MNKPITIALSSLVLIGCISIAAYLAYESHFKRLPTYFSYSKEEIATLNHLSTSEKIIVHDLLEWDMITYNLVRSNKLGIAYASQVLAYLYTSQRDAAFLSYNKTHAFKGSLDPLCAEILCLFFANHCTQIKKDLMTDEYSVQLAKLVVAKVKQRMESDQKQEHLYLPINDSKTYWQGKKPYYGQSVGSWKPWVIDAGNQFRSPKPSQDESYWKKQTLQVKQSVVNATDEQKVNVVYWASGPDTMTLAGRWLDIATKYMLTEKESLQNMLLIRSVLAMGIADAVIASFDSLYTYWTKRPYMRDSTINPVMPTPNRPSYPATHSVISATAATILTFYFPQNSSRWFNSAHKASQSGLEGGVHFPVDIEQGFILGVKIGQSVIKLQDSKISDVPKTQDQK